jgi:hypothetical protein
LNLNKRSISICNIPLHAANLFGTIVSQAYGRRLVPGRPKTKFGPKTNRFSTFAQTARWSERQNATTPQLRKLRNKCRRQSDSTYNIYHYHLLLGCFSIVLQSFLLPSSAFAITPCYGICKKPLFPRFVGHPPTQL